TPRSAGRATCSRRPARPSTTRASRGEESSWPSEMAQGSRGTGIVVVVAAAILLRFWNLPSAGISHWDAGTYTAGPLGVGPYARGESVLFQTPPLVPGTFRALFAIFGTSD